MTALAARSQNARVLRALRRGPVSLADFLPPTADGGPSIVRLPARIHNLKALGHVIDSRERDEHGCAVYRLVRDAEQTSDSRPRATGDEHSAHAAMVSGESPGRGFRSTY